VFFNQNGFSLIEAMVVASIIGILALAMTSMLAQGVSTQHSMQIKSTLHNLRMRIDSAIKNQQSWQTPEVPPALPVVNSTVEVNFDASSGFPADPNMASLI